MGNSSYRLLSAEVAEVLHRCDPEALLDLGAPATEYDPDVPSIVRLMLNGDLSEESLAALWEGNFGNDSRMLAGTGNVTVNELVAELSRLIQRSPQ